MGMYTEFFFRAEVRNKGVEAYLDRIINTNEATALDDHPFFSEDRWHSLFFCSSAYFNTGGCHFRRVDNYSSELIIHSSFKHYGDEIRQFYDWITPYLDEEPRTFLGFSLYEEDEKPTLHYMPEEAGK